MNLPVFIEQLKMELAVGLPGIEAQMSMMPPQRRRIVPSEETIAKARRAGVCLLLYMKQEKWHTVLIRRTSYEGVHSGQMAFPGGTYEEIDKNLRETAIREAIEEVGIDQKKLIELGQLSPIYIPPSNMYVEPLVAYLTEIPQFLRQESEVAEIVELNLEVLLNPANRKEKYIRFTKDLRMKTPYFDVYGHTVWGATAAIFGEFVVLLKKTKVL